MQLSEMSGSGALNARLGSLSFFYLFLNAFLKFITGKYILVYLLCSCFVSSVGRLVLLLGILK